MAQLALLVEVSEGFRYGGGVMSVRQPSVRQTNGGGSFPDPKRSWGRTGSLLATWGVLLLAVYFAGWVFEGFVDRTPESSEHQAPGESGSAAWQFLNFALVDRDADDADGLLCSSNVHMTGSQTLAELTEWEDANDVKANVLLSFDDETGEKHGDTTVYPMEAKVKTGPSILRWKYLVHVVPDGGTFCVSKVENVTPEN